MTHEQQLEDLAKKVDRLERWLAIYIVLNLAPMAQERRHVLERELLNETYARLPEQARPEPAEPR